MLDPGGLATMKNESQLKAKGRLVIEREETREVSQNKRCTLALCKPFAEAASQPIGARSGGRRRRRFWLLLFRVPALLMSLSGPVSGARSGPCPLQAADSCY